MAEFDDVSVLVIEDEQHARRLIVQMLRQIGVGAIYEATEGESGFRETIRIRPTMVICDIYMEPVNGLDYLVKLRGFKIPEVRRTPVVFLTVDGSEQTEIQARRLMVDGYLVKPVLQRDMEGRIRAAVARRGVP